MYGSRMWCMETVILKPEDRNQLINDIRNLNNSSRLLVLFIGCFISFFLYIHRQFAY